MIPLDATQSAEELLEQGFEIAVIPGGSSPNFETQGYFKELRWYLPFDSNLAARSASTFALRVRMGFESKWDDVSGYTLLDQWATLKVVAARDAFFVFRYDPAMLSLREGGVRVGPLQSVELVLRGFLAHGRVNRDEWSGAIVNVERSGELTELPDDLRQILEDAQSATYIGG